MTKFNRRSALALCGVVILSAFVGTVLNASPFNKQTYLKFSRAVALPGVTLEPGEYSFEVFDPNSSGTVVRVKTRRTSKHVTLALTRPTQRPAGARPVAMVTLGETRPGIPTPIRAWFPEGENIGYEFIY